MAGESPQDSLTHDYPPADPGAGRHLLRPSTISEALQDDGQRAQLGLPTEEGRIPVLVEINQLYVGALTAAKKRFEEVFHGVFGDREVRAPIAIATNYFRCWLTTDEVSALVDADQQQATRDAERTIYRVWPDFPVEPLIDRSVATVKGDAALRAYEATGVNITWAVVDSGVCEKHPHFAHYRNLEGEVEGLHRDFTDDPKGVSPGGSLHDGVGHGTHVAGIIAGGLPPDRSVRPVVGQHIYKDNKEQFEERRLDDHVRLTGVAPECKLISLKVFSDSGASSTSAIMQALHYVRTVVNTDDRLPRVHGVNLSVGYKFDPRWFACGQSPLCVEVDRLVKAGVVVVVAAGNDGYGQVPTERSGVTSVGLSLTIRDPGNAALAITVGATHRDSPHLFGVSYFSSKGPTGDGRLKPDLVAPGERITSCAAGRKAAEMAALPRWNGQPPPPDAPVYIDDTGTSLAAPHVSGAIAGFLSIRREFIGRPEEVKSLFLRNATSLGRERYFEGSGLVDLMRTIQAV